MDGSVLYLVRAGAIAEDTLYTPRMTSGRTDVMLSRDGRAQIEKLGAVLRQRNLTGCYTSPSTHAVETAYVITRGVDVTLHMLHGLRELNYGEWSGKTHSEIMTFDTLRYSEFLRDPGTNRCKAGESLFDVQARVVKALYQIAERHINERVVVVSHPMAIRAFLAHLAALPLCRARDIDQSPGCVNVIRWQDGVFALGACNQQLAEEETEDADRV